MPNQLTEFESEGRRWAAKETTAGAPNRLRGAANSRHSGCLLLAHTRAATEAQQDSHTKGKDVLQDQRTAHHY